MDLQNLGYALTQVVHNFGAAAVLGGSLAALWRPLQWESERKLGWLVCIGWATQIASGSIFGAISFHYYGRFPDISGVAVMALILKVICASGGFFLAALYLWRAAAWPAARRHRIWLTMSGLSATALTAAAFLRWFS
jgi:hypothetical protein